MGIKSILSLIAFASTFVLSSSAALLLRGKPEPPPPQVRSCRHRDFYHNFDGSARERISRFLQQDIANGQVRRQHLAAPDDEHSRYYQGYTQATMIYVNASESLDDSGLPADFQLAWRAHIRAWREHSDLLNRLVWRSDNWDGADLDLYREQSETINETWSEVKSVAYSYGATFTED